MENYHKQLDNGRSAYRISFDNEICYYFFLYFCYTRTRTNISLAGVFM